MPENRKVAYLYLPFYLLLSLAVLWGLLPSGYLFTLHMVYGPAFPISDLFYGFDAPLYGGSLPFLALVKLSFSLFPPWVVQKAILVLILFLCGVSAHSLVNTKAQAPRFFAGILYTLNPLTYTRLLVADYLFLLGYAVAPFAVKSFWKMLEKPNRKSTFLATLWVVLLGALDVHMLLMTLIFLFACLVVKLFNDRQEAGSWAKGGILFRHIGIFIAFSLLLSAYWLIPVLTEERTALQAIGKADLEVFRPRPVSYNALFTITSMYGYWRGTPNTIGEIIPWGQWLFLPILFLTVYGFISHSKKSYVLASGAVGVLAIVLGSGASGPFAPLFTALYERLPLLKAFRDSHKFVALLALVYAYLGALGVQTLGESLDSWTARLKRMLKCALIVLAVAAPLLYSLNLFTLSSQLKPADYPEDWYRVKEILEADPQDSQVLFLPWHAFMDYRWNPSRDKRTYNPAPFFFSKPVTAPENLEVTGIYTQSTNPGQLYIDSWVSGEGQGESLRQLLTSTNVKYILLAKESNYLKFGFLYNQSDLKLIYDSNTLALFENSRPVSRFYQTDTPDNPLSFTPWNYTRHSLVEYSSPHPSQRYLIFVPPNMDAAHWSIDGKPSASPGHYAVYDVSAFSAVQKGELTVYYRRFTTYKVGYGLSLLTLVLLLGYGFALKAKGETREVI